MTKRSALISESCMLRLAGPACGIILALAAIINALGQLAWRPRSESKYLCPSLQSLALLCFDWLSLAPLNLAKLRSGFMNRRKQVDSSQAPH